MERTCIGIVAAVALALLPAYASAHATPTSYTPEAGTSITVAPENVDVTFSERIEPKASSIKVFAPDGSEAHAGAAVLDMADPRHFSVPFTDAGEGVYTVSWQVVSVDDGHFTRGSYSFITSKTGEAFTGSAETVQVTYVTSFSEALYHTGALVGESIAIGVLFFVVFILRACTRARGSEPYVSATVERFVRSLGLMILGSGALFLLSNGAVLIAKSSELAELRGEMFFPGLMAFLGSTSGTALVLKMLLGGAFTAGFCYWRKALMLTERRFVWQDAILALFLVSLIVLQSKVSHAAASFFLPDISVAVTMVHLFFKELLIGGAAVLLLFVAVMARQGQAFGIAKLNAHFDRLASVAILFGGTTGAYISWLHLKRLSNLHMTEWGERFLMLLAFGGLLACFRMVNQFLLGKRAAKDSRGFQIFRTSLSLEVACGLVVLFYSAYISITTPPFLIEQYAYHTEELSGSDVVYIEQHPYESEMFRIGVRDATGAPVAVETMTAVLTNREKGIEGNVPKIERRTAGTFVIPKSAFTPQGTWEIRAIAQQIGAYDRQATFTLRYPDDVVATRYSDEVRTFDGLAKLMLGVGIVIILGALVFYVHATRRLRRLGVEDDAFRSVGSIFPTGYVSGVVSLIVMLVAFAVFSRSLGTTLESKCLSEGFSWQQALPARDMAPVSPNSLLGCWIHGGHYHLPDEAEFDQVIQAL